MLMARNRGERGGFGGGEARKGGGEAAEAEKRARQERMLARDIKRILGDEAETTHELAVETYGKEKTTELEQELSILMAQIESERKHQYYNAKKKAENDQGILKKIERVNEILADLGQNPMELEAGSMPLHGSDEEKAMQAEAARRAEEARRAAMTPEEREAEDRAKAEAEAEAKRKAAEEKTAKEAAEAKLARERQLKEKMATWLVDDTKQPIPEELVVMATGDGRKTFWTKDENGQLKQIANPMRLRDGQIVTDENGNKLIYHLKKSKKTGKYREYFTETKPQDGESPEAYAAFVRKARENHAKAVGLKVEELSDGEIDEAELEQRRAEYREMLTNAKDRLGHKMFSDATIENIVKNYDGKGMMLNPVEEERRKALEMARDAQRQAEKGQVEKILNGRDLETFTASVKEDFKKLSAEIAKMRGEGAGGKVEGLGFRGRISSEGITDPEIREKRIRDAQGEMLMLQRKLRLVERVTKGSDWNQEIDGKQSVANLDDIDLISPDPVKVAAEAEKKRKEREARAERKRVQKKKGEKAGGKERGRRLSDQAAGGELDFNNPGQNTKEQLERANVESVLMRAQNDPEFAKRLMAIIKSMQNGAAGAEGQPSNAEAAAESKETKANRLFGRVKNRLPFRKRATRALTLAAISVLMLVMSACGSAGLAYAADDYQPQAGTPAPAIVQQVDADSLYSYGEEGGSGGTVDADTQYSATGETGGTVGELPDLRREDVNGLKYDFAEGIDNTSRIWFDANGRMRGMYSFGVDRTEYWGDKDGTRMIFETDNHNIPYTLASTASAYPSVLRASGLEGAETAGQIYEMLKGENGPALQDALEKNLQEAFNRETTDFDFYIENGTEQSYYVQNLLGLDAENTPANLVLKLSTIKRNGQKQVRITIRYEDENGNIVEETGDFNMQCGFQRNIEIKKVITTKTEKTPTKTPEKTPETTEETEETEEEETEEEETEEEETEEEETEEEETEEEETEEEETEEEETEEEETEEEETEEEETEEEETEEEETEEEETEEEETEEEETEEETEEEETEEEETEEEETEEAAKKDAETEKQRVEEAPTGATVTQTGEETTPKDTVEAEAPKVSEIESGTAGKTIEAEDSTVVQTNTSNEHIQGTIQQNMQQDQTQTEQQQQENHEAQQKADQDEITEGLMSDQEFEDYINSILNGL